MPIAKLGSFNNIQIPVNPAKTTISGTSFYQIKRRQKQRSRKTVIT
jgi:hypothetical protein